MSEKSRSLTLHRMVGSSAHSVSGRANHDYYATDPIAGYFLYTQLEDLEDLIVDNSVGAGHLVKDFPPAGFSIIGFDIENREKVVELREFYNRDFLKEEPEYCDGLNDEKVLLGLKEKFSIVMNPPYSKALEFVKKSLELQREGGKVCAFLKIQFLESRKREKFFKENPPVRIHVSRARIQCAREGDLEKMKSEGRKSMACYAWFIWEKGYKGSTTIEWFN